MITSAHSSVSFGKEMQKGEHMRAQSLEPRPHHLLDVGSLANHLPPCASVSVSRRLIVEMYLLYIDKALTVFSR